ncbi:MAG: hypothetical protein R3B99_15665 [Polyangiales bacterium]
MIRLVALVLLVGCYDSYGLGGRGCDEPCVTTPDGSLARRDGGDSPIDGGVLPVGDAGRVDAGGRRDAGPNPGRRDAGTDPVFDPLPDDPPPDSGLEPGTPGYYLLELCYRSRSIACRAARECCTDPARQFDDPGCEEALGQSCTDRWPGKWAPVSERRPRRARAVVDAWAVASVSCTRAPDNKLAFSGTLRRGERCDFLDDDVFHNSSLCEAGLHCPPDTGVCTEVGSEGDACIPGIYTPACDPGLWCDGTCRPLEAVGSACGSDGECRSDWCEQTTRRCAEPTPANTWCARI